MQTSVVICGYKRSPFTFANKGALATQIDLPKHVTSGLRHAMDVLKKVDGISFTLFEARDAVRHPIVQRIVMAYEKAEAAAKQDKA